MKKPTFGGGSSRPVAAAQPTTPRHHVPVTQSRSSAATSKVQPAPVVAHVPQKQVEIAPVDTKPVSKALQAAHEARRLRSEAGETMHRLNPVEKLAKKPTSLRFAINAKCFTCQGEDQDIGVRKRIGTCNVVKCPLHAVRPYQKNEDDDDE